MNKQNKLSGFAHMWIFAIILVLIIVGALGYAYYKNYIEKKDNNTSQNTQADTQNEEVVSDIFAASGSYEGWQTFANQVENYTLKYPSSWVHSEYQDHESKPVMHYFQPSKDSSTDKSIVVESYQSNLDPEAFAMETWGSITKYVVLDSSTKSIDGKATYCFRYTTEESSESIARNCVIKNGDRMTWLYLLEKNGNKNELGYVDNTEYIDEFNLTANSIEFNN